MGDFQWFWVKNSQFLGFNPETNQINAINYILNLLQSTNPPKIAADNMSLGYSSSLRPENAQTNPLWQVLKTLSDTNSVVICIAAGNGFDTGLELQQIT